MFVIYVLCRLRDQQLRRLRDCATGRVAKDTTMFGGTVWAAASCGESTSHSADATATASTRTAMPRPKRVPLSSFMMLPPGLRAASRSGGGGGGGGGSLAVALFLVLCCVSTSCRPRSKRRREVLLGLISPVPFERHLRLCKVGLQDLDMSSRRSERPLEKFSFPSLSPGGDPLWQSPGCSDCSRLTRYQRQTPPPARGQGSSRAAVGGGGG